MGRSKKGRTCPKCGSKDVLLQDTLEDQTQVYLCMDCDHVFEIGGRFDRKNDRRTERDKIKDTARRQRDIDPHSGR
ncbi:MAG TPA: hypothetical protein PLF13_03840 [candidate division Zixibacteria bacterium]|nr:hypothetical protein [candidate division Zixibacteria bacterium]